MAEAAPRDPWLLTPGPLTTAESTKRAMLHDWGSRDSAFIAMTARVRRRLVEIAGGGELVAVPLQGSGTFAVEAAHGQGADPRQRRLRRPHGADLPGDGARPRHARDAGGRTARAGGGGHGTG